MSSTKPTQILLSISSLVPTLAFPPPDELVSLSTSLLSQSQQKAARLKPEEEVARTFACAHIACERLRDRLGLEIVRDKDVRSPAPPRIYNKLKGFLQSVLGNANGTPSGRKSRATPTTTPSKRDVVMTEDAATPTKTPVSALGKRRRAATTTPAGADQSDDRTDASSIIMPLIRHICKQCRFPSAVPHVFVGATTIAQEISSRKNTRTTTPVARSRRRGGSTAVTPRQQQTEAPQSAGTPSSESNMLPLTKYPSLLTAIFLLVFTKMTAGEIEDAAFQDMRQQAVTAAQAYLPAYATALPPTLSCDVEKLHQGLSSSVGFYLLEAQDCGWLDMEWYGNIATGEEESVGEDEEEEMPVSTNADNTGISDDNDDDDEEIAVHTPSRRRGGLPSKTPLRRKEKHQASRDFLVDADGRDVPGAAGLLPGLATMFQPCVDWLSEQRQMDYSDWRTKVLKQASV